MLLLCEAGEGIGLVSPSVMRAPGKSSLYMKIHYKQKAKREKKNLFPVNKENWPDFNNK